MSEEALRTLGLENVDLDILDTYRGDQQAGLQRWGASGRRGGRPRDPRMAGPGRRSSTTRRKTAPQTLGAWALWNGSTNPDGFIGQMWSAPPSP